MFLPEGAAKRNPASTEFVELEKLLDSFHQDLFTGWCEFRTRSKRIVLLFEEGGIKRAFRLEKGTPTLLLPSRALEECQISGEVRWAKLPPEVVDMMVRLLFCEQIHQNLSSIFVDFKKLLKSLEDGFTGYLEIGIGKGVHYLFLENGGPRSALYFSGDQLIQDAEALEKIFGDAEVLKASINIYALRKVPLKEVFLQLSKDLLFKYSELKGPVLASEFWKKLSQCAQEFDEVGMGNLEFRLDSLPTDLRKQEEILVSLLQCQIEFFNEELGKKTVENLYLKLLEDLEPPMKELFGVV